MPLIRRKDPLGGGLMIAAGCVFCLFGLFYLFSWLADPPEGAGSDLLGLIRVCVPGVVVIVMGIFAMRLGFANIAGRR
jgi:hypothetical protein